MSYRNDDHCTCASCRLAKAEAEIAKLRALIAALQRELGQKAAGGLR